MSVRNTAEPGSQWTILVALGIAPHLHLQIGNDTIYLKVLEWGLNAMIHEKCCKVNATWTWRIFHKVLMTLTMKWLWKSHQRTQRTCRISMFGLNETGSQKVPKSRPRSLLGSWKYRYSRSKSTLISCFGNGPPETDVNITENIPFFLLYLS